MFSAVRRLSCIIVDVITELDSIASNVSHINLYYFRASGQVLAHGAGEVRGGGGDGGGGRQ